MANPQNSLAVIDQIKMQISPLARQELKYVDQELGAGIAAPFAVIGFKGGKWSIRHRGNTTLLMRYDAHGREEGPLPFIEVVILFAASHHSKVYYAKNYQDGDDAIPDCWSTDGLKPDQAAPDKQNPTCADCRHNKFGSRVNQATGGKGKACADTRRMAVVPHKDITNEILGGPMLLRVPPASLGAVGEYSDFLKANAIPYSALATRVGFDPREAYPKMVFEPFQALSDDEVHKVRKMQDHPLVERIVQEQVENMVAQTGSEQGVNQTAPKADPGSDPRSDPGPIPPHLDKAKTNGAASAGSVNQPVTQQVTQPATSHNPFAHGANTGPSYPGNQAVQGGQAAGAPQPQPEAQVAPDPVSAPAQPALTPEQARILELEAKLAAAEAKQKAPRKTRTPPVAPSTTAEPAGSSGPALPPPVGPGAAFGGGAPTRTEAQIAAALPGETTIQSGGVPSEDGEEDGSGSGAAAQAPVNDPALASISARLSKLM
jgi:hypothetical protein